MRVLYFHTIFDRNKNSQDVQKASACVRARSDIIVTIHVKHAWSTVSYPLLMSVLNIKKILLTNFFFLLYYNLSSISMKWVWNRQFSLFAYCDKKIQYQIEKIFGYIFHCIHKIARRKKEILYAISFVFVLDIIAIV